MPVLVLVRRVCHRVIKYYAWENNFSEAINDVRRKEIEVLKSQAYWRYVARTPTPPHLPLRGPHPQAATPSLHHFPDP